MFKVKTNKELKDLVNKLIEERGYECDLNDIDVSEVTYMSFMFEGSSFNGDISKWDVSNVENMSHMFKHSPLEGNEPDWYKDQIIQKCTCLS